MNNVLLVWQFLRRYPVIPIFILILLLVSAAIGPYITPYERDIGNIADRHLSYFQLLSILLFKFLRMML